MHLPAKQKLVASVATVVMLGGVSYAGLHSLRPDAPMSVTPISGTTPPATPPSRSDTKPVEGSVPPPTDTPKPTEPQEVVVAMAGAVKVPGLLHMPSDARVGDAIKRAGGAGLDADLDRINLAAKLVDGDQVYVPHKKAAEPEKVAETEKVVPKYRGHEVSFHDAPLPPAMPLPLRGSPVGGSLGSDVPVEGESIAVESPSRSAHGHGHGGAKAKASGPVSLNTAGEAELETLPGVGPSTAQKILDYRQEHGGFGSVEEITSVKGIGEKKFAKMKPFLKL